MRQKTEAFIYFYPLGLPLVTGNALALGSEMLNEFQKSKKIFFFVSNQCSTKTGVLARGNWSQVCYEHQITTLWTKKDNVVS